MVRFSIVIPVHNGEQFIRQALDSALRQTRKADEVLVINDASTDKTTEIINSLDFKGKLTYMHNEKPTGFVDAWNRAVEFSSGDFVVILHQDDLLASDYLDKIEKAVQKYPQVRHLYTACNYIDEKEEIIKTPPEPHSLKPVLYSGKTYAHNYLKGIVTNNHIHRCPGVTTSRELLIKQCRYRKEAGHIADDDFFLRVGAFTDVVGISQPLASYREHTSSQTHSLELLTLQLAKDYVFQTDYYKKHNTLLDPEDVSKINHMAAKFINLLLFQSLFYKNKEWLKNAFNLRVELEEIINGIMETHLPGWAKVMWRLTDPQKRNSLANFYVSFLNTIRIIRDAIRKV